MLILTRAGEEAWRWQGVLEDGTVLDEDTEAVLRLMWPPERPRLIRYDEQTADGMPWSIYRPDGTRARFGRSLRNALALGLVALV